MGSTQSVIIVLDNWEAKVVGWVSPCLALFFVSLFFFPPFETPPLVHFSLSSLSRPCSLSLSSLLQLSLSNPTNQGPTPVYRAPPVGYTFSWGFYEYLWYANTYGSWGWKSPPLSLVMYDNWGNRLQVEVFVTLNLKTWEVWNTKITNIQFLGGGGWGNGK